ncbi:MAG: hypothetical protein A3G32_05255 [Deltaproteobacteria bacterium RIFCSPLOWO2_12_FULL_40_28]|nr:MAG: hypothetical protein A3C45_09365 [Deltaproteobacteria bacterium RIFCSPHIGHO2_02_FULL_40_28]OGQ19768.1 MAG: hypothetical protein A3E27_08560 [Deltaproteobacteria bacterium RIFCSPHIGHO2_12_FULL_40_32]OGQ41045.1 MAG: hypothetical protein A3I69_03975 [Deltaproteobacteria bacterium RIFCSPLOWO2_02_FULL_40_36]OGQ54161.1 MAG: hypothetical protein A3G32_05255 [Deltaproteobacteria bacterium RIFCSPLOWO2_12_FULL_40_28]
MKAKSNNQEVNLYTYTDYRIYLKVWYVATKQISPSSSYRSFAKRAGFKTSNFLWLVIQGKRNLTEDSIQKICRGLNLNKQEQDYFRNLVYFNQSTTNDDRVHYYEHMLQSRKLATQGDIEKKQYEYYTTWYHPVVRELVAHSKHGHDPEWIAKKISPSITSAQVIKSISLLAELGFIKKKKNGGWTQTETILSTGPELVSTIVHNYHKSLLHLTQTVLDQVSMKNRDISSLTLGVKKERIPQVMKMVRNFRQEVLKLVSQDTEPEEVVLLNLQFFPVTQMGE